MFSNESSLVSLLPASDSNNVTNNSSSVYLASDNSTLQCITELMKEPIDTEVSIENWRKHCNEFQAQRKYVIQLADEAKKNREDSIRPLNTIFSILFSFIC